MNRKLIPYGRQHLDSSDIHSVVSVLKSDWITQGPKIRQFEQAVARYCGSRYAVAVSSGTAALHTAMHAAGIGPGDEVIVPPITFVSTVNSIVFQGAKPVFADVDAETLLLDPTRISRKITSRTKAIIAVDYAGQPCDYDELKGLANRHDLLLISDACHSLGARYKGKKVGTLADLTALSFHPVKHITTGEGGMVLTPNPHFADRMVRFRNHGLSLEHQERIKKGTWRYSMTDIGYNYRITDFQCALGLSQLKKLPHWLKQRSRFAQIYNDHFQNMPEIQPLKVLPYAQHAYHLYVIQLDLNRLRVSREEIFKFFRNKNILVNVHYLPVYLQPFYQRVFGTYQGLCPVAESAYERILSLPIYAAMTEGQISYVIQTMKQAVRYFRVKKSKSSRRNFSYSL